MVRSRNWPDNGVGPRRAQADLISPLIDLSLDGIPLAVAKSAHIFGVGGVWRSLVAHLLWEQRVGGSNPLAPTTPKTY
jgi:hypothetical protein